MNRPKRKAIPQSIKRLIVQRQRGCCPCGCDVPMSWLAHRGSTRFDHHPALFLRIVNEAGDDYEPAQLDPAYIVARCIESDEERRSGGDSRATTAGKDTNAMAKQRERERKPKFKRAWPTGRKMQSRPFQKRTAT